jgi:hypothetical protein
MEGIKRTQFSQQGLDFATLFAAKHSHFNISGYVPVLREPPGETTAGGKQAMQHIVLLPKVKGDPLLTIGSVNVATRSAKLRSYDCMRQLHEMRFDDSSFFLDQPKYLEMFEAVLAFMKKQGIQVEIETNPPRVTVSTRPPPRTAASNGAIWFFIVALLVAAVSMVGYLISAGRLKL